MRHMAAPVSTKLALLRSVAPGDLDPTTSLLARCSWHLAMWAHASTSTHDDDAFRAAVGQLPLRVALAWLGGLVRRLLRERISDVRPS